MGGKFKFQVQDSDLEYLFWQCEKYIALSAKKSPLAEIERTIDIIITCGVGRNRRKKYLRKVQGKDICSTYN